MLHEYITWLILIPFFASIVIAISPTKYENFLKFFSFGASFLNFMIAIIIQQNFDSSNAGYQFVQKISFGSYYNLSYHVGIDGISLYLILLTTLLFPICILSSWKSITTRVKEYLILFLVLESIIIGVFTSLDVISFYIFFEASLIPMYLIIGIWGGDRRIYASFKFFLYTLAGSLLFLLALIYLISNTHDTDINIITNYARSLPLETQKILWIGFFTAFAIKIPMWPFHTWLPDAHVQAPTSGSVILAGILLKLGGYAFLRFSLPMLPDASIAFSGFVSILSIIAVIYASMVAFVQTDIKKLVAYSSVAHMSYVTIGIFSCNTQAVEGAIFQMLSHGIISSALFLIIGVLYERTHTRDMNAYGGVANIMPKLSLVFMIFTMASVGLPGTSGFIGEFLVMAGVYKIHKLHSFLIGSGMILGAVYMLFMYMKVMYGKIHNANISQLQDLSIREISCFIPLILLTLATGINSDIVLADIHTAVQQLIEIVILK